MKNGDLVISKVIVGFIVDVVDTPFLTELINFLQVLFGRNSPGGIIGEDGDYGFSFLSDGISN
jgi:hypothetical protein